MVKPAEKTNIILRLPKQLHARLKKLADESATSLNQTVVELLRSAVGRGSSTDPVVAQMQSVFGIKLLGIVLFGSTVRGTATDSSDIDFLVVVEDSQKIDRSLHLSLDNLHQRNNQSSLSFSPVHLPKSVDEASTLWLEVALEGKVIFDPFGRVHALLRELRLAMASGQLQRGRLHGQPYWKRNKSGVAS